MAQDSNMQFIRKKILIVELLSIYMWKISLLFNASSYLEHN